MTTTQLVILLIAAVTPFVSAILAAANDSGTVKAVIAAVLCLIVAIAANLINDTFSVTAVLTAYLEAIGAAQTAWMVQIPIDLAGKLNENVAPGGVI